VSGPDSSTGGYLAPTSGPIEDDALLDLIQGAIVGITGITGQLVRPRWQLEPPDAPDVGTNWCAFGIVDRDQDTFGVEQWNPEAGNETVIRHETINILASFYGPGCDGLAMQLRDGLILAQNREALGGQGLEFISCGKPQRAPEPTYLLPCDARLIAPMRCLVSCPPTSRRGFKPRPQPSQKPSLLARTRHRNDHRPVRFAPHRAQSEPD
jgi:hypothetical protein